MSLLDIKKDELKYLTEAGIEEYDRQLTKLEDDMPACGNPSNHNNGDMSVTSGCAECGAITIDQLT